MYKQLCDTPSDINEHLPTLKALTEECETVTEMGVRYCVSTFAFLEGKPKKLTSIDIKHPNEYEAQGGVQAFEKVLSTAKEYGVQFNFIKASTLDIEIEPTDLLFIDTLHEQRQLEQELVLHSEKAKKYLVFHDTVSCKDELMPAIDKWLSLARWKIKKHYENNNGLLICERARMLSGKQNV